MKTPCKDCTDRYIGCHGECELYLDYRAEINKCREIANKQKEDDYYFNYCGKRKSSWR